MVAANRKKQFSWKENQPEEDYGLMSASKPHEGVNRPMQSTIPTARHHDIDWLRLMAVFLLFFFHTARIFDPQKNFYVQNNPLCQVIFNIFVRSLDPWHMSLFFLLAGASTYFALRQRSGGQYAKERLKRLFIPFVFGIMVLIPPQSYLGLVTHSDYSNSFFTWFPNFFTLQPNDMDGYFLGGHTWGHLWFIFHLFVYSLIALPLFLYLNRESGKRLISKVAAAFTCPGVLFLIPLPLALLRGFPDIVGGNPFFYIILFISGYVLMSDPRFSQTIDQQRFILLFLGPVIYAFLLAVYSIESWHAGLPAWINEIAGIYFQGFVPWFVILTLLAYGKRLLNFTNGFLKYFADASYPLYLLHQTAIIIIGYYVVKANMAVSLKYGGIVVFSFTGSVLAYDLLVRRNNVIRFLFGMKPRVIKQRIL